MNIVIPILLEAHSTKSEQSFFMDIIQLGISQGQILIGTSFLSLFRSQRSIHDLSRFTFQLLIKMSSETGWARLSHTFGLLFSSWRRYKVFVTLILQNILTWM